MIQSYKKQLEETRRTSKNLRLRVKKGDKVTLVLGGCIRTNSKAVTIQELEVGEERYEKEKSGSHLL